MSAAVSAEKELSALPPKERAKAVRALLSLISSPCVHMRNCVQWRDDNGKLWVGKWIQNDPVELKTMGAENPVPNTLQRRVEAAVEFCRLRKQPVRIIVLKGRRSGASLICGKIVDLECRNVPTAALMMADKKERTKTIFEVQCQMASSDVFPWGFGVVSTDTELNYGNGSCVLKETANDTRAGMGSGYRVVWLSEAAHFPTEGVRDARKLMMATLGTVPKTPESMVLAESTANGCAGWFYDRWLDASWPILTDEDRKMLTPKQVELLDYWRKWDASTGGTNESEVWVRVFAAWFEIPRNRFEVREGEAEHIMARLSESEKALVERYHLDAGQIKWMRFMVRNDFGGSEEKFGQENPPDPQSAFIASGSPAFSRESLATIRGEAARAQWQYGVLVHPGATVEDILHGREMDCGISFKSTPKEGAWFAVLEPPKQDLSYFGGVDPASFKDVTDGEGQLDKLACGVMRGTDEIVNRDGTFSKRRPRFVARIPPELMEHHVSSKQTLYLIALLMRWYGNPPVVVETQRGEWVIKGLLDAGINLMRQHVLTGTEQKLSSNVGHVQTDETRHSIILELQRLIHGSEVERIVECPGMTREGEPPRTERVWQPGVEIECLHAVGELETFVLNKGRWAAASGRHDDDVLLLAMMCYYIDGAVRYRVRKRRR